MRTIGVAAMSLLFVADVEAAATSPSDFEAVAAITGESTADVPVQVVLPAVVLSRARADFADLRLFDDLGQETPYVIYEQTRPGVAPASHAFEIVSYHETAGVEELFLKWPRPAMPFNELEFVIVGKDFNKRVEVAAGTDADSLRPVTDDVIFDFTSRVKLRRTHVRLSETRANFVRITLKDAQKSEAPQTPEMKLRYEGLEFWTAGIAPGPFRIEQILGWTGENRAAGKEYDRVTIPEPTAFLDQDGNTIVDLNIRVPVTSVALDVTNAYYHRRVQLMTSPDGVDGTYRVMETGVIYRVPGMPASETVLRFNQSAAHLRLKVLNEDNPPLRIPSAEVAWVRRSLYFVPEAGRTYRLFVGSDAAVAPSYELGKLIAADPERLASYPNLSLASLQSNPAYHPPLKPVSREPMEKATLTALVVVVICALSFWAYRLLKHVPRPTSE